MQRTFIILVFFILNLFGLNDEQREYLIKKYSNNNSTLFYELKTKEINLLSENGARHLLFTAVIGVSNKENMDILKELEPIVYDTIIRVISSKIFEEISTPKGKLLLSWHIAEALNKKIDKDIIQNIYFVDFLIKDRCDELMKKLEQLQ